MRAKHLLLTGAPGIGKTTVIKKVVEKLSRPIAGFYSEEIRINNTRQGFALVTFEGRRTVMAHTDFSYPQRVGKYGVDVSAIDSAVQELSIKEVDLYIVDEIGKMECLSPNFIEVMENLLDSHKLVVATVALKGKGFISHIKHRPDCEIWEIRRNNRDSLPGKILNWIENC